MKLLWEYSVASTSECIILAIGKSKTLKKKCICKYIYINIKKTQVYNIHTGPRALKNTFQNHRQEKHLDRDFSSLVVDLERFPIVSNKEL